MESSSGEMDRNGEELTGLWTLEYIHMFQFKGLFTRRTNAIGHERCDFTMITFWVFFKHDIKQLSETLLTTVVKCNSAIW